MSSYSLGRDVGSLPAYSRSLRHAQRGGYTPGEQRRRERLRLEAAKRFARGDTISEIAPGVCGSPKVRCGGGIGTAGPRDGAAVKGADVTGEATWRLVRSLMQLRNLC
jgi:hypothetical protein